jgi:hypothetical protein
LRASVFHLTSVKIIIDSIVKLIEGRINAPYPSREVVSERSERIIYIKKNRFRMYPTSPSVRGEKSLLNHYGSINSLLLLLLYIKHHYYYIAITI